MDIKRHTKFKVGFVEGGSTTKRTSVKSRPSLGGFVNNLDDILKFRKQIRLLTEQGDKTPPLLEDRAYYENFGNLAKEITKMKEDTSLERLKPVYTLPSIHKGDELGTKFSFTNMNVTMDDITAQICVSFTSDDPPIWPRLSKTEAVSEHQIKIPQFIKILLRQSDDIVLYEQSSATAPKDSEEAANILENNKRYEHLTVGKGKNRRRAEAEAQTVGVLYKSRKANTEKIRKHNVGTYVSNYDMFDTYAELGHVVTSIDTVDNKKMEITTYTHESLTEFQEIGNSSEFKLAAMLLQRLLAGNIFCEKQKRFRNMYFPDPLSADVKYLYRLEELWTYTTMDAMGKAVASMSWCHINGDILAVGYGIYSFVSHNDRMIGLVCVWSIKNPVHPERKYRYSVPVTAVSFSHQTPQLLAIGLYDGTIEIRDITDDDDTRVSISQRSSSPCAEPILHIEWIMVYSADGTAKEQMLSISQDGNIMKYSMTTGPYLLGFQQMKLDRVEGMVEGIPVGGNESFIEADRNPQALTLKIHPEKSDTYFVGTDEGCLLKCSTNYPHQHTDILQVHKGGVFGMEFSPWSSKIFLTCGSDWCIRIWVEGVFEPLIRLSSGIGPVHCAYWSPINSTIIIGVTKTAVEIWDIRRSTLKPESSKTFGAGSIALTIAKYSNCGRSLVVGDNDGTIHVCALEDMPFPRHFQYEELESAIYKALIANPELTRQVQSLGFLGYQTELRKNLIKKHLAN